MRLKRDVYWWILKEDGKLAEFGRHGEYAHGLFDGIAEGGCPNMLLHRKQAKALCRPGERPVKVRLVKVEE